MVFDVSSITDGEPAVNVLGQVDFLSEGTALTATGMNLPYAITIDSLNEKLYVSDKQNFRVLIFDVSLLPDGELAVNVLGSDTFTDSGSGTTDSSLILVQDFMNYLTLRLILLTKNCFFLILETTA